MTTRRSTSGFTLSTTDRREAVDFARRQHAELERQAQRERHGLPGTMPVSGLFDKFQRERLPLLTESTSRTYSISLGLFRRFFVEESGTSEWIRFARAT